MCSLALLIIQIAVWPQKFKHSGPFGYEKSSLAHTFLADWVWPSEWPFCTSVKWFISVWPRKEKKNILSLFAQHHRNVPSHKMFLKKFYRKLLPSKIVEQRSKKPLVLFNGKFSAIVCSIWVWLKTYLQVRILFVWGIFKRKTVQIKVAQWTPTSICNIDLGHIL